jgi:UDP-sugar transporter A1/2/3
MVFVPFVRVLVVGGVVASVVLTLDATRAPPADDDSVHVSAEYFELGVVPVLAASLLSGLAAALSQRSLQTHRRNSYLFTMELAVFSSAALAASLVVAPQPGLWRAWTPQTLAPVLVQGVGGIVVGLVMKHAGGVQKGFAIMGGILLSSVFQMQLYGQPLSRGAWIALPLVLASTWIHIAGGPRPAPKKIQ